MLTRNWKFFAARPQSAEELVRFAQGTSESKTKPGAGVAARGPFLGEGVADRLFRVGDSAPNRPVESKQAEEWAVWLHQPGAGDEVEERGFKSKKAAEESDAYKKWVAKVAKNKADGNVGSVDNVWVSTVRESKKPEWGVGDCAACGRESGMRTDGLCPSCAKKRDVKAAQDVQLKNTKEFRPWEESKKQLKEIDSSLVKTTFPTQSLLSHFEALKKGDKVAITLYTGNKTWRGEVTDIRDHEKLPEGSRKVVHLKGLVGGSVATLNRYVMRKSTGEEGVFWTRMGQRLSLASGESGWVKGISTDTSAVSPPRRKTEPSPSMKAGMLPGVTYVGYGRVAKTPKNLATFFSAVTQARINHYDDMGSDNRTITPTDQMKKSWIADLLGGGGRGEYIYVSSATEHVYHIHMNHTIYLTVDPSKLQKATSSVAPGRLPGVKYERESVEKSPENLDKLFAQIGSVAQVSGYASDVTPTRDEFIPPKDHKALFDKAKAHGKEASIRVGSPYDGRHILALPAPNAHDRYHYDKFILFPRQRIRAAERRLKDTNESRRPVMRYDAL